MNKETLPTMDDVLKKHSGYKETDGTYNLKHHTLFTYKQVKAAMQEWASLQTPSNEKYWRERCEAAEYLISPDAFKMLPEAWRKWRELKSTPIPILTPCANLLGEIELGWHESGRRFEILGDSIKVGGQRWTPMRYMDEEDPDFIKTAAIKIIGKLDATTH